jgi:hypothetical protein
MTEKRQRRARCRTDAELLTLIRKTAADRGVSAVVLKDKLYSLLDRERAGQLMKQMEAEKLLVRGERKVANGGPVSWRLFLEAERAAAFAAGQLTDPPKMPRKPKPAPTFVLGRMPTQTLGDGEAVITSATQHVQGPSGHDNRYTVRELPQGYRSQISAAECRPWAAAAVQGRAAA